MRPTGCGDSLDTRRRLRQRASLAWLIGTVMSAGVFTATPAPARIPLNNLGLGKLELSGNLQTQNIVRHRDINSWQFIMQRNVFRTRVDWQLIRGGKLIDRWKIPGVRKANVFMLYRFSYDSIYDFTPDVQEGLDLRGTNLRDAFTRDGVNVNRLSLKGGIPQNERDTYKFENTIREAYIDLKFRRIPLGLRIGRQQIVWGESDNFRMLDRVNALDTTWHFAQEVPAPAFGWDEIRRPYFMIKALYNLGNLGPISQAFFEMFWNPGDWYPAKIAFLPRPWGIRILDPLTNPWDGAFVVGGCITAPGGRCTKLMNDTVLFKQGNYDRWNPAENSMFGIRFHGATPQGINFTLNYLRQRWSADDGTDSAVVRSLRVFNVDDVVNDPASLRGAELQAQGILPAEYWAPYINTIGLSANYSDEAFTQAVFRLETVFDMGIPFFDRGKLTVLDDFLPGVSQKNMWKGMIGFDRPTWIRTLNKKSSFFISGQFFWHYLVNNPDCPSDLGNPNRLRSFIRNGGSCLTGGLDLPSARRPKSESFRDKVRTWETIATIAAISFYRGGSIVPVVAYAVDPMNRWVSEWIGSVDWYVRPNFAINVTARWFFNPTGEKANFDPWGFGSQSRTRSETGLRFTYQF